MLKLYILTDGKNYVMDDPIHPGKKKVQNYIICVNIVNNTLVKNIIIENVEICNVL